MGIDLALPSSIFDVVIDRSVFVVSDAVFDVDAFAVIDVELFLGLPLRTLRCAELSCHPYLDVVLT